MIEFLAQFASMAVFIVGLTVGEIIGHKAFGRPKSALVMIIDILFIVFMISAMYSFVGIGNQGIILYVTNFVIGLLTIIIVRAVEWGLGLTENEGISGKKTIDIIRILAHHGLDPEEIRSALKQFGLPHKGIEKYDHLIEKSVPKYVPKLVKMEKTLDGISEKLSVLEKRIKNGRKN